MDEAEPTGQQEPSLNAPLLEDVTALTETEPVDNQPTVVKVGSITSEFTSVWRNYTLSCYPIDPVDPEVLALAEKKSEKLTFFHVSGPAIKAIGFSLPLTFVFVLLFPVAAWAASQCPNQGEMYAHCPYLILVLFVPVFLLMTWWEWNGFRMVVVPYVQWLAPFKILGFEVSLQKWLPFMIMLSSAAKLDIATNSLFAAKVFATFTCPCSLWSTAQAAWEEAIRESCVAHVPLVNQLLFICLLGWIIILVQLVLAFLMSHPWQGVGQTDFNWKGERNGYSTLWTRLFDTCHSGTTKIWHADVVRILAPAIRNVAVVGQGCNWQMERVRKHLEMKGTSLREQRHCFLMLYKEAQRTVVRLWAFTILERYVVIETQTSMYALIRAVDKEGDLQIYLALLVSFMCLIKALPDALCQTKALLHTHQQVMDRIQKLEQQPFEDENDFTTMFSKFRAWLMRLPGPGDLPTKEGVLLEARRAKRTIVLGMCFGTLILLVCLAHAFAKLVMVRYCAFGFWNVPLDLATFECYGCVDPSHQAIMEARHWHQEK